LRHGVRRRTKYLAESCGKFVTEATIEFDARTAHNIREFYYLLKTLSENRNLKKLVLLPSSCRIEWPERRPTFDGQDLPQQICDTIVTVLETSVGVQHLSLGCIGELTDRADVILYKLSRCHAQKVETVHISSVKEDPDSYGVIDLPCHLFGMLTHLRELGIDYDYMSNHLLDMFSAGNRSQQLQKLIIHVHGIDLNQEKICNRTWQRVVNCNPSLAVTLNLIHSFDGAGNLLDLLQPAMPLSTLRMFFCGQLRVAALNFIAQHMSETFQQLHVVDGMSEAWGPAFYDDGSDTDPFVMLAWKCKKLSHLTVIGYALDHDDVVGISRLRGDQLQQFSIPDCCILEMIEMNDGTTVTNMGIADDNVLEEISSNLGITSWHPIPDNLLHPAVFDHTADAETAYLHILMKEQV